MPLFREGVPLDEKLAILEARVTGPYALLSDGRIDCMFNSPFLNEVVPFTACADDSEEHGRLIHHIATKRMNDDL